LQILIIGNGRAGQRHNRMLQQMGHQTMTVDTYATADYPDYLTAMYAKSWDAVVIATPPKNHLEQLWCCIAHGIPVLCEKPLCDVNQYMAACSLPRDKPIMVAYNWLYNASVQKLKQEVLTKPPGSYGMLCEQSRELPAWGLLLDHVSHDVCILDYISGGIAKVGGASYYEDYSVKAWTVLGETMTGPFSLSERVWSPNESCVRKSSINAVDLVPETEMYSAMLEDFVKGKYTIGVTQALVYQKWLEELSGWQSTRAGMQV
jgi:hypothetical protein